jgi:hypothetical protein
MPVAGSRLGWPLMFALQPSTLDLLDHADYLYDLKRDFDAPAQLVVHAFFADALAPAVAGLHGFTWHTPAGRFDNAVVDEHFVYMALRMRTVTHEPGVRLAMSIDRCSLPLGRQMLQVMDTTPLASGGCRFHWRIAVRYLPGMSAVAPALTPVFRKMFEQTLDAVERIIPAENERSQPLNS